LHEQFRIENDHATELAHDEHMQSVADQLAACAACAPSTFERPVTRSRKRQRIS
jgi:hypothetical protein